MATYLYETIPASADEPVERFEIQQSMMDNALGQHPDTGKPIRRIIVGGFGYARSGTQPAPSSGGG